MFTHSINLKNVLERNAIYEHGLAIRDLVQLVHKCIIAPEFNYLTVYGVSANSRKKWNNDDVTKLLNSHPQDNAEDFINSINYKFTIRSGLPMNFMVGHFVLSVLVRNWYQFLLLNNKFSLPILTMVFVF